MNVNVIAIELEADYYGNLYIALVFYDTSNNYQQQVVQPIAVSDVMSLGLAATITNAVNAVALSNSYTVVQTTWTTPAVKTFATPSLAVNTARQPSTTRDTLVNASVDITASLSLTTGQKGSVTLRYADDSGFTTNVVNVQVSTNGNTGTLALGLALGQIVTSTVSGIVPAGKYYELLTTNVTGTPTYGTPVIQEVLL